MRVSPRREKYYNRNKACSFKYYNNRKRHKTNAEKKMMKRGGMRSRNFKSGAVARLIVGTRTTPVVVLHLSSVVVVQVCF